MKDGSLYEEMESAMKKAYKKKVDDLMLMFCDQCVWARGCADEEELFKHCEECEIKEIL